MWIKSSKSVANKKDEKKDDKRKYNTNRRKVRSGNKMRWRVRVHLKHNLSTN